jgi:hypothetical protein
VVLMVPILDRVNQPIRRRITEEGMLEGGVPLDDGPPSGPADQLGDGGISSRAL